MEPTQNKKPEIPQTKGLFPGPFGKYYKDAEKTQYMGKVVKGQWVPATPDDIAKDRAGKQGDTQSPAQKAAAADSAPESIPDTEQEKIADHLKVVHTNFMNKFTPIWANAISGTDSFSFKLGLEGTQALKDFPEIASMSDSYPENMPYSLIYGIQESLGRKKGSRTTVAAEEDIPTSVIQLNFEESTLTKDKDGNTMNAYGAYFPLYDLVAINTKYLEDETFNTPLEKMNVDHIDNVITLTHEVVHSSSPRFYKNYTRENTDIKDYWATPTKIGIEEGLTEYIARATVGTMINKAKNINEPFDIFEYGNAYNEEVQGINELVLAGELDPVEIFQTAETFEELLDLVEKAQRKFLTKSLVGVGLPEERAKNWVGVAYMSREKELPIFDTEFMMNLRMAELSVYNEDWQMRDAYLEKVKNKFVQMRDEHILNQPTARKKRKYYGQQDN